MPKQIPAAPAQTADEFHGQGGAYVITDGKRVREEAHPAAQVFEPPNQDVDIAVTQPQQEH